MLELINSPDMLNQWIQKEFEKYHEYDPFSCLSKLIDFIENE